MLVFVITDVIAALLIRSIINKMQSKAGCEAEKQQQQQQKIVKKEFGLLSKNIKFHPQ